MIRFLVIGWGKANSRTTSIPPSVLKFLTSAHCARFQESHAVERITETTKPPETPVQAILTQLYEYQDFWLVPK